MEQFLKHFIRGQAGWWECVAPTTFKGATERIKVTRGSRFFPGTTFMGVDVAKRLDKDYQRSQDANPKGKRL